MTAAETVLCPDCQELIPAGGFVQHREREHPPELRVLAAQGIRSQEAHGYQPPSDHHEES